MQPCPRGAEATMSVQLEHLKSSHWRDDGTCSYCGSISPATLFAAIEAGFEVGPTDKNYKVYVDLPNPHAGEPCIDGGANFKPGYDDYVLVTEENKSSLPRRGMEARVGSYVHVGVESARLHAKFYFQHLDVEERKRFVELLNAKKIKIGYPGYFYQLPFFCVPLEKK
jgi:hypothetical protein